MINLIHIKWRSLQMMAISTSELYFCLSKVYNSWCRSVLNVGEKNVEGSLLNKSRQPEFPNRHSAQNQIQMSCISYNPPPNLNQRTSRNLNIFNLGQVSEVCLSINLKQPLPGKNGAYSWPTVCQSLSSSTELKWKNLS